MREFKLSNRSRNNLNGVKPELVAVVFLALKLSSVDFAVIDGLRTIEEQKENVRNGVSKTMNSKHLMQGDGFGHAVDLMPCGFSTFDAITPSAWDQVNQAVKSACIILNYTVENGYDMWGWDKPHWQINS